MNCYLDTNMTTYCMSHVTQGCHVGKFTAPHNMISLIY